MNVLKLALFVLLVAPQAIVASAPARQSMDEPKHNFDKLSSTEKCASVCCCACSTVCCFIPILLMKQKKPKQNIQWPSCARSPRSCASPSLCSVNEE